MAGLPRTPVLTNHHEELSMQTSPATGAQVADPREPIPPELFLAGFPSGIGTAAERLRGVVTRAVPDAIERVRPGWRLIGYEVPLGKRSRYFAFVAPEVEHVHLGFEYGAWMDDPAKLLRGAHLNLRKVRFLTFEPGDPIPEQTLIEYTREAAALATMSGADRLARELEPGGEQRAV
jgi:hypothetical protein